MNLLLKIAPLLALLVAVYSTAVHAATVQLPRTGQTLCYDATGNTSNVIGCAGTGQDGDKQAGVPIPDPRFTDNGNGTVTDNLTELIWLKDAGCTATVGGIVIGTGTNINWPDALTWSGSLKSGDCGLSDGSVAGAWRLPNITELESLVELHQYPALASGHPFSNVKNYFYWTSSSYAINHSYAWGVSMDNGDMRIVNKAPTRETHYVWPVRTRQ